MQILRTITIVGLLLSAVLPLSGCLAVAAAGAAGAGVAYATGDTHDSVDGDPHAVSVAAEQTLTQMGIVVISTRTGVTESEVIGRTGRDDKVDVTATLQNNGRTHVSVRVGTWGKESLQNDILARIRENLRYPPAAAVPAEHTEPAPSGGDGE